MGFLWTLFKILKHQQNISSLEEREGKIWSEHSGAMEGEWMGHII
jgi:hypothetical protein